MTFISGKSLQSRGFTLIELLVVISIIALLAAIVLASLNTARNKAKDAAIKELATQMRNVYELEMTNNGSYRALMPPANYYQPTGMLCPFSDQYTFKCQIVNVNGCTSSIYTAGSESEKICKSIFDKGGTLTFGVIGNSTNIPDLNNEYALWLTYPSNINTGVCIRNNGSVINNTITTDTACLTKPF